MPLSSSNQQCFLSIVAGTCWQEKIYITGTGIQYKLRIRTKNLVQINPLINTHIELSEWSHTRIVWWQTKLLQQQPADVPAKIVFLLERCTCAAVRVTEENLNVSGLGLFFQQKSGWPNLSQNIHGCRHGLLLVPQCNVAACSSPNYTTRHRFLAVLSNRQIQQSSKLTFNIWLMNQFLSTSKELAYSTLYR